MNELTIPLRAEAAFSGLPPDNMYLTPEAMMAITATNPARRSSISTIATATNHISPGKVKFTEQSEFSSRYLYQVGRKKNTVSWPQAAKKNLTVARAVMNI
jgi:hypothetical protein